MRYSFLLLALMLTACSQALPLEVVQESDDGGPYTVSATRTYTLADVGVEGSSLTPLSEGLRQQALQAPMLTTEIRNYSASTTGSRSRAVAQIRWGSSEVALLGTLRVWLEDAETGLVLAAEGAVPVSIRTPEGRTSSLTSFYSPYFYGPSGRMCVGVEADVRAEGLGGDALELRFKGRSCEGAAQGHPQDTVLASRAVEEGGLKTTVELRFLEGVGHRALVRYEGEGDATGRLCLHEQGKASCRRSTSVSFALGAGGVAEAVTGYHRGLEGLELCAGLPTVNACASGERELLKRHSYDDGINTNVSLVETTAGVVARVRFSVPEGVTLLDYAYLDFIHGHDYEAFFSLSDGEGSHMGAVVPTFTGPAERTLETPPLALGLSRYCFDLGAPYQREGEYPELIRLEGCTD